MGKPVETVIITVAALLASALLVALFIAFTGNNPLDVFYTIYRGAFGSSFSWQNTLVRAAPLMLAALCTVIPARLGLIVIGGEGAIVVGGLTAALTGIALSDSGPWIVIPAMLIVGMLAGGVLVGTAGALKYYRGVNETISSLLLNYISIAVLMFLVVGPLKDPATLNKPSTFSIGDANMLGSIGDSSVHWGLAFGVATCVLLWFVVRHTTAGFAGDVVGGNARAAKLVGLPVGPLVVAACAVGGAAAAIAGVIEVAAVHGRANGSLNAGYGYAGILVAFLARQNPLAVIPFAILLGGIRASGGLLQRVHDLPDATVLVIQGIIFVTILASDLFYGRFQWRPAVVPASVATPTTTQPAQ
ncbi:MAG TPA: ABC transporter permease [Dongiaceae bacterium]|nr:ABC transporter permease [Dongiaceae bacterium]